MECKFTNYMWQFLIIFFLAVPVVSAIKDMSVEKKSQGRSQYVLLKTFSVGSPVASATGRQVCSALFYIGRVSRVKRDATIPLVAVRFIAQSVDQDGRKPASSGVEK